MRSLIANELHRSSNRSVGKISRMLSNCFHFLAELNIVGNVCLLEKYFIDSDFHLISGFIEHLGALGVH